MKTTKRFFEFIALLAVIALAMTACYRNIPNNTDWIVKAKDKSGNVPLYSEADGKTSQITIPDGSVVKGAESAGAVIGSNGWSEYRYKVDYEGKFYYIREQDLRKQTKESKAPRTASQIEFHERKKKEWEQFGIWLGMMAVVFTGLYFWNKTRSLRALKKYYAKKRREFPWFDNYFKQNGDPSRNRAVNDSAQSIIMSIFVCLVLMVITYLISKLNFTLVMIYLAISVGICVIMGIKNAVSPGKYYDLDIQDLTLECPSCHCPHSWGMKSKEVIIENKATIVYTTKRDGYEDKTEEGGSAYGVKTIIDFICLNCGHAEQNEYHTQWRDGRPPDVGMNRYNPIKTAIDVEVNTTVGRKFTGNGKKQFDYGLYKGDFVNGKPHGKGKMSYKNNNVYEGDFVNGKPHGKGKMIYCDGRVYEGDYAKGRYNGKGKETYANGYVYEGEWKNGEYHGKGKATWVDGGVYEGDYVNGKFEGRGKYSYPNGQVQDGRWKDGKFVWTTEDAPKKRSSSGVSNNGSSSSSAVANAKVRYDGVYQSPLIRDSGTPYYFYLRFYEDKTVIHCSSVGEVNDVKKWFNKENGNNDRGKYKISGNQISFTVGKVDFKGSIPDDVNLLLDSHSRINGNKESRKYSFAECFDN